MAFDFTFDETFEGNVSHTNILKGFDSTFDATFESAEFIVISILDNLSIQDSIKTPTVEVTVNDSVVIFDEIDTLRDFLIKIFDSVNIQESIGLLEARFISLIDQVNIEDFIDLEHSPILLSDDVSIDDSMMIFNPGSGNIERLEIDFKQNTVTIKFRSI